MLSVIVVSLEVNLKITLFDSLVIFKLSETYNYSVYVFPYLLDKEPKLYNPLLDGTKSLPKF